MVTISRVHARLLVAACLVVAALAPAPAAGQPTELFFSEYIEGSSNNKALEIYNGTGAAIDLAAGGYNVQMFFNGNPVSTLTINLTGTVAAGDVFVLAHSSANATILAQADQTNGSGWFNGDDAVVLRKAATVVDAIGQIGVDPGTEWGTGLVSTGDNTLRRGDTICAGDLNGSDVFDPSVEWNGFAQDTFDGLGAHAVNCYTQPPVINEFSASTAGTDVEYLEILGSRLTNLSDLTILEIEGDTTGAGVIDEVVPVGTTDGNGLYLVSLPANALENGTITLLLVRGFTGAINTDLDTNNDGVFDLTPWDEILDAVAVNDGGAGDLTYGAPVLGVAYDGLSFAPGGASRIPDGFDTNAATDWVRNDFDLAGIPGFVGTPDVGEAFNTPGASNSAVPPTPADAAPEVTTTYPANGATDFPVKANLTVTFSEPVNVTAPWFTLVCSVTGTKTATVTGGPTTFTIDPDFDFVNGESCTLTIIAAKVSDQDANDPPDNMVLDFVVGFTAFDVCAQPYTPIYDIQGSGATVALPGTRTTQGVVVGDYEGPSPALRGFFIQDPLGDGNPATSDGIFVFEGSNANTVSLGDVVRVTGTAGENQGQSQISVGTIAKCGAGTVTPTDITLPAASADFLERYEGMLVRLPQKLYVTEHFQLGRFGQVVLSAEGRLRQPTDVAEPGTPALELQAQNDLNRIVIDDSSQGQNPDPIPFARGGLPLSASNTLRGGDTATGIVGVLNYTWGGNVSSPNAYRVRPVNALGGYVNFEVGNPRPDNAPEVGGMVRVASMNLLNYYNTFAGCTGGVGGEIVACRGAESQAEFERQWPKSVAAILKTGADVLGLIEVENDGYGPTSAIADLVDRLNAATAPGTYAFVDADTATSQVNALGTDGVKVGIVYKPTVLTPLGTAALNSLEFQSGGDPDLNNRPSLAQAFQHNAYGAKFVVVVNHLRSKGSACEDPDAGDGQGNCNVVRVNAATELAAWLATDPTGAGDPDVLLLGDFNSYTKEDPLDVLVGAGFTNLAPFFAGPSSYTYVFDAQWGSLDHAFASPALLGQVTGTGAYHVNADEPSVLDYNTNFKSAGQLTSLYAPDEFRMSDHDPLVVGITPVVTFTGTDRRDDIIGTDGPDRIQGGRGGDTLTGKGGPDVFVYLDIRDANDTITDFNPAEGDLIDLSAILRAAGYPGGDAIADGWVRVIPADGKFMVQVDLDGPGPLYEFRQVLVVKGPAKGYMFTAANFVF